jgi:TPR repeat protein
MKKLVLVLFFILSFAFDFKFTKAFQEFNRGVNTVKTNPQEAQKHFEKAFEIINDLDNKNSSQVYYMLGRMYCNGWGVKQNFSLAEKYFKKALNLGNQRVHCCLARLYIKEGKYDLARKHLDYALTHPSIKNYCNDINESILKEQQ